ncbi:MAG TPA: 50S ribosomal protein L10 [Rubrobacteraceae bacterium]|nr:50S ribosomal protein L10 [Rubrobacteraceae bacterium]
MKREDKARVIEELTEKLKSNSVVLVDYKGINVAQSDRLRARSRESGVEFVVAKNTLAQIAADRAGIEDISELLVGPTAIAFSEDPVTGAKLMDEFSNEIDAFELKGGLLDSGRVVDAAGVARLSRLPGREQLIAQVVGGIQAPLAGLVTVLNGTIRNLAIVLNQVAAQKRA